MEQEIKKGLRNEKKKEMLTLIYRKINDIKQIIYWLFHFLLRNFSQR